MLSGGVDYPVIPHGIFLFLLELAPAIFFPPMLWSKGVYKEKTMIEKNVIVEAFFMGEDVIVCLTSNIR
jgi:hypothetical protein